MMDKRIKYEKKQINSFEDLNVYQKLFDLEIKIYNLTLKFPRFELYELGSQLRRAANSAAANLAEGWGYKHIKLYLEGIIRSMAEIREIRHHLKSACYRKYIDKKKLNFYLENYNECYLMLKSLKISLEKYHSIS